MQVDISNIVKVYSGKRGCMCGCKGKYSYTVDGALHNSPGYDVNVNERSVKIIANKVLNNPAAIRTEGNHYVFVEDRVANRIQVVYFGTLNS